MFICLRVYVCYVCICMQLVINCLVTTTTKRFDFDTDLYLDEMWLLLPAASCGSSLLVVLRHHMGRLVEVLHKLREAVDRSRTLACTHADEVSQTVQVGCGEGITRVKSGISGSESPSLTVGENGWIWGRRLDPTAIRSTHVTPVRGELNEICVCGYDSEESVIEIK